MKISQCCRNNDRRIKVKRKKGLCIKLPHRCNCEYCPVGKPKGILKKRKSVTFEKSHCQVYKIPKRMSPEEKRRRGNKDKISFKTRFLNILNAIKKRLTPYAPQEVSIVVGNVWYRMIAEEKGKEKGPPQNIAKRRRGRRRKRRN